MSIDDVHYLKKHSMKQNYSFLVNSEDRNYLTHPDPNCYIVEFTKPFRNVIGLEIIDASIPRTMYSIDKYNNELYYVIMEGNVKPGETIFKKVELEEGDYDITTFIRNMNGLIEKDGIKIESISNPPELKNKIMFKSEKGFILDMNNSTMRNALGFNLTQNKGEGHRIVPHIYNNKDEYRYFHSKQENGMNIIKSPGIVDLIGEKYIILRCEEIESHSTRSLAYSKHSLGLAKFRLGVTGYNDETISFNKTHIREFHPIGKLPKITLKFVTSNGKLYDFKGVNHNITFNIMYYEATKKIEDENFEVSHLNPNYKPNMLEYMKDLDEQDDESDESDEELTRDDIDDYKKNEMKVSRLV
tara:strand:- start:4829 stop:5899 length:1071 start_codon:yes stop_codon:yes gene_type:complete